MIGSMPGRELPLLLDQSLAALEVGVANGTVEIDGGLLDALEQVEVP